MDITLPCASSAPHMTDARGRHTLSPCLARSLLPFGSRGPRHQYEGSPVPLTDASCFHLRDTLS